MAEGLKKKLHIRNGHRGHVSRLITGFSRTDEQDLLNLKRLEKSLEENVNILKNLDDEILELISENEAETLTNEIDKSCQISDEINDILVKIESIFSKSNVENSSVHTNSTTSSSVSSNPNDSHTKLTLDKFNGELLSWQSFWDQYSVAIHTNGSLSDIEKFNYVRSYLTDLTTGECIKGLSLTSASYQKAVEILKERYGNKQILISSYMDVLVKLPKADNMKDIDKLRKIYNSLETSVRNLADLGVEITSYGTLLISIIFDRIPTELKLLISRKFKNNIFDLDILTEIFKEGLFARERVQAIDVNKNSSSDETDYFTGHNLLNNSRKSDKRYEKKYDSPLKVCVYCGGKNHISTRCNTITHIETRRNILKKAGRCFLCLSRGHLKYSCVKCDSKDHNVSICDKINEKNHDAKRDKMKTPTLCKFIQIHNRFSSRLLS